MKKAKRILSRFLVLTMIISLCVGFVQVSAATFTVTLGAPATAQVGTQFDLSFTASGLGADVASMWVIRVTYDNTKVTPDRFTSGANNGKPLFVSPIVGSSVNVTEPTANSFAVILDCPNELAVTTLLGTIKFTAIVAGNPAFTVVNSLSSAADFAPNDHSIAGVNPTMTITPVAPVVDKAALTSAITTAEALLASKTVGIEIGNVPQAAATAFGTAITNATTVKNNASATQTEVDNAVTALATATTAFNASVIVIVPKSTDANLTGLSVTGATLNETFAVNSLAYTATVANSVTDVTIVAAKSDTKATVTGDGAKTLVVGPNVFNVVVTAEDTSVTKTYVVTITREAPATVGTVAKAGNISGYVGQNVIVPITITQMTALNNFDVAVSYDSTKLQYVSTAKGASITETPAVSQTVGKVGISGLTVAHGVAGLAGDVVVANVTFKVIDTNEGSSIVSVLRARYNSTNVLDTNFVSGTASYIFATDSLLTAATTAVEAYEAVTATTIAAIDSALTTEKVAADTALALVVAPQSQDAKAALQLRINAKTSALNNERDALVAEQLAALKVVDYEEAPITTLVEVAAAEAKATAAYAAVNPLRSGAVKDALLARIVAQDLIVAAKKAELTAAAALAAALAKVNAGTATLADYTLVAPATVEALIPNYNRGVIALGSNLTQAQVIALVAQVNTPAAPVITYDVIGEAVVGEVLSIANYTYSDANYDVDPGTIVWNIGGTDVSAATYTVLAADAGKVIKVTASGKEASVSAGAVTLIRGDVNMDGTLWSDDAYEIRKIAHETGTYTNQQKEAANYDNLGVADVTDILKVLEFAAAK